MTVDLAAVARDLALCTDDTCPCTVSTVGGVLWRACGLHDPEVPGRRSDIRRPSPNARRHGKYQG